MADVKWIKIVTDIFDNRKIRQIEIMPEGDSIIVIWFKLLCLAGKRSGCIDFPVEMTDQVIAAILREPVEKTSMALEVLERENMIVREPLKIYPVKFYLPPKRDRSIPEYKSWRSAVFSRDGYRCKVCGTKKDLQAHHIVPWSKSVKLRYSVDNGITLCRKCHLKAHGGDFRG